MVNPMVINIEERWSLLKKAIEGDANVRSQPELRETVHNIFKTLDQNLTGKLVTANKAAAAAANSADANARDKVFAALNAADAVLAQYEQQLKVLEKGFFKKHESSFGLWKLLTTNLAKIRKDVAERRQAL